MILTGEPARDRPRRPGERAHREGDGQVEADQVRISEDVDHHRAEAADEADDDRPEPAHPSERANDARPDRDDHRGRKVDQQDRRDDEAEEDRGRPLLARHQAWTSWPAKTRSTSSLSGPS